MQRSTSSRGVRWSVLASAISAMCTAGAAYAQQQVDEEDNQGVEELVVTGTRIPRNDFTTPNPVATMDREDIDALGLVSVGDILGQITSNVYSASLDTVGDGAFFVGATLANLRGMNTGFGTRTLTLVNGRRMPPTTNGGGVDLAMIPSVLVGRVETATGGNGATYGTDAMAGVVNIIIDNRFEGTRVDTGFYQTDAGDGNQYSFSLANGMKFLDEDRGHLVIGYEHQTVDPIHDCSTSRDWCARSFNWLDNAVESFFSQPPVDLNTATELPAIEPDNIRFPGMGWSRYHIAENVRNVHTSRTGSLHTNNNNPADPFNGEFLEFTPDGRSVIPYNTEADGLVGVFREAAYATPGTRVVGGEGDLLTKNVTLRNGSVRNNFYSRFNYDFNERLSVNAELSFNRNNGETFQQRATQVTHCILPDNPFLAEMDATARQAVLDRQSVFNPATFQGGCSVNGQVAGLTATGTALRKNWVDQIDRRVKTETEMLRFVVGANGGMFGSDRWTWDTYFQYGETDRYQLLQNNQTQMRLRMAEDAYLDPNTGEIVCRINATDAVGQARRDAYRNYFVGSFFAGGLQPTAEEAEARVNALRENCVPLNPFGYAASPEALAYAWDDLIEYTYTTQRVLSGTVSGTLFDGIGAGPARIATGIDWREDLTDNEVGGDPNPYVRTDFGAQYGDPWVGGVEVGDVFAEFELPLLRDKPGARYMMMNVSNRRSRNTTFREDPVEPLEVDRYSTSWKTSFVWDPVDWLRVRSTRSMDVRSPAPRELFYRQTQQGGGTGFDFFNPDRIVNPWRDINACCDSWDTIIGANPNLQNEESRTETIGFVFTPGGSASGLQFAVDYVNTYIKGGISYATGDDPANSDGLNYTIFRCFEYDDPYYCDLIEFGPPSFEEPNNPRSDILSVTTTQENTEPFWTKAFDLSASYRKRLSRGGDFSIRLLATYTKEQNICTETTRLSPYETVCNVRQNVVGQTGGLYSGGNVFANYTATPDWSGNLYGTYRKGPFSVTAQGRYVGQGAISTLWVGPEDPRWAPERWYTMDINRLPSWTTWNATFGYDFAQSRFAPARFEAMDLQLVIDNVFDKQPGFYSGGGIGGVNTRYFSGIGRAYRLRLNMQF